MVLGLVFSQLFRVTYGNFSYVFLILQHLSLGTGYGAAAMLVTALFAQSALSPRLKAGLSCLCAMVTSMLLRFAVYFITGLSDQYTVSFFLNPFTGIVYLIRSIVNLVDYFYYGIIAEALLSLLVQLIFFLGFYLPLMVPLLYYFWFLPAYTAVLRRDARLAEERPAPGEPPQLDVVTCYLLANGRFFPPEELPYLEERLRQAGPLALHRLPAVALRDPSAQLIISVVLGPLGIDRFLLGDTGVGVLKLLTGGCCGVLTVIDWFSTEKRTRLRNLREIEKIC